MNLNNGAFMLIKQVTSDTYAFVLT